MPFDIVWFQLPNMSIYFNRLLAWAVVFYVIYFFTEMLLLDCSIKDNIPDNKIFWVNRILGVLRIIPIIIIVFSMYNIDNTDIDNVLRYNKCINNVNNSDINTPLSIKVITCQDLIYGQPINDLNYNKSINDLNHIGNKP